MAESALKSHVDPGSHRVTWSLSKPPATETWDVSGEVDLQGSRQPTGTVFGTAPVNWTGNGSSRVAGYPQHFDYTMIRGEMNGNLDVLLLDPHLTVFGGGSREGFGSFKGGNAYFDAWAALVGIDAPRGGPLLIGSGEIQVPHLEAFADKSPIAEIHFPHDDIYGHDNPLFSAQFDKSSLQEWRDDDAKVAVYFNISANVGGWHRFDLKFSPVVSVELSQPVPLAQFFTEWAWPLRGLIAAATGKRVDISHLTCTPVVDGDVRGKFQVFNASVTQTPYLSTNSLRDNDLSAIRLGSDGESLLRLLRQWQHLRATENPILNTYDISAVGPGQHPRARFLLLVQALEGLFGYEGRSEERQKHFASKRETALATCREQLEPTVFNFVRKHLPKRAPLGCDAVLREMVRALPVKLESTLAGGELVKSVRSENSTVTSTFDAIRVVRNDLSHGNRTYDRHALSKTADIFELVVRAHLLRLLGASDQSVVRVLSPNR